MKCGRIRVSFCILLTGLGLLGNRCAASAQETQLAPGTRLRATITHPLPEVEIGEFRALTDTTLVLSSGASTRAIPLTRIGRLEWSRGRRPSVPGAVAGLLVGAAIGGVVACDANRDSYGVFCGGQNDTKVVFGAAIGGVAGGALGAFLFRRDRWQPVDLSRLSTDHR